MLAAPCQLQKMFPCVKCVKEERGGVENSHCDRCFAPSYGLHWVWHLQQLDLYIVYVLFSLYQGRIGADGHPLSTVLARGQVCWGFPALRGFLSCRSPAQLVHHYHPINVSLFGPAAKLFEERRDGFCVSISHQRYL